MSTYTILGVYLLLVALFICVCHAASRLNARHDAAAARDYARLRTPGMGDLSGEPTPIFDQLCLERLDASLDERPVYDIDDDFHGGGAA